MEFSTSEQAGAVVVHCRGRLNMVAAPRLKELLGSTVEGGHGQVVVDLTDTDFVDSSGLGALVGGLKRCRQAGGDLRIAGAGEQVRTVLALTRLDRVLRPYDDVAAAVDDW